MSKSELLNIINTYPVSIRLELIQSILTGIRIEQDMTIIDRLKQTTGKDLLEFAGVWDENTAQNFHESLEECRKIDLNEW